MNQAVSSAVREELLQHPLYKQMNNPERIRVLMKHHVFAVWDFMSLLKRLQQQVTCVNIPWVPVPSAAYARFINEIVLGEETDEDGNGGFISHYELYVKAMREVGADASLIDDFMERVRSGIDPRLALNLPGIPESVRTFVKTTLEIVMHGQPHEVASAFFFGREDLIPEMFQLLVDEVESNGLNAQGLKYYLHRHIEVDGNEHGPLAQKLLSSLCEDDPVKFKEADRVAEICLRARIKLWDGVLAEINESAI